MLMFKKNYLSSFIICVMFSFVLALITMSVFASEVNAAGYVEIDNGDYKVYVPEETASTMDTASSSSGDYKLPPLIVPATEMEDAYPDSTYQSRTIYPGVVPERFDNIPVRVKIGTGEYDGENNQFYNSEFYEDLAGRDISHLNAMISDEGYDIGVSTFLGIFDPTNNAIVTTFPLQGDVPEGIILLLNKESHFAEGLTLDIEEWWQLARAGIAPDGTASTLSIGMEYGLSTEQTESAVITHGFGTEAKLEYENQLAGITVGATLSYNYADERTYAISRTYHAATTETVSFEFGYSGGNAYKWGVYNLVTNVKVNYNSGVNFGKLDDVFDNDLDDVGLTTEKNTYFIQMVNKLHASVSTPVYDVDTTLAVPQITATPDFGNLTTTISWNPVTDSNVEGFFVYKNDSIAATILDPTVTSWTDVNVKPEESNTYKLRSFRQDNLYTIVVLYYTVSNYSNEQVVTLDLTSPEDVREFAVGCSIPLEWTDSQPLVGERTWYNIHLGDPSLGGDLIGSFEGNDTSINISPELYDLLVANPNDDLYITKEILYDGQIIQSDAILVPNNFTVTETAFLFENLNFKGDCITVSKGQSLPNLHDATYDFGDKLKSMIIQGNVYVRLFEDGDYLGYAQAIFSENGYYYNHDLDSKLIQSNTVSSIEVKEQEDGVYAFSGYDFTGDIKTLTGTGTGGVRMGYDGSGMDHFLGNDNLDSVKVIGDWALVAYQDVGFKGNLAVIKDGYGEPNLADGHALNDNAASSINVFKGEGVYFFNDFGLRGAYEYIDYEYKCSFVENCGMTNDRLSSVLTIGNRGVTLYEHSKYGGKVQAIRHKDDRLDSSGNVGDNTVSSFKIFGKGVYLFTNAEYDVNGGYTNVTTPGNHSSIDRVDFKDNTLSSIFVIGYKVTLYEDPNFGGASEEFNDIVGDSIKPYDNAFGTPNENTIGNDKVSSLIIEEL
ncbi:beta/gamma crystallin family protein [Chengkuizengella sediminis]|uniref:beta/gamma crystallin family protein n=1 Tax=Chengkuizengella sediminis TaxID=1885917 RepID=UPI00138A0812|nr:beta/gamma crystallin family protein [Chengkuizengella sediminis]NDI34049.1 beta/gamma crystallin family protein [Chengkuizengella sediminis]